jgi:hypothetical protein
MRSLLSTVTVVLVAAALPAQGQLLLQTGFESATFTAESPIDGQDGWVGFFAPAASLVSAISAHGGRRCIAMQGSALALARPGLVAAACGTELLFDPVAANRPLLHVSARVRLDGPDTGEGPEADLLSANLYVVNTLGQVLGGFFLSSNGAIYAFGRGGQDYMFPTPYVAGTYAQLALDIDFDAGFITFAVNGDVIGTLLLDPHNTLLSTEIWTAALEMASIDAPQLLDVSLYTARFDDVLVSAAPRRRTR